MKTDTRAKLSQDGLTGPPFIQLTGGSPGHGPGRGQRRRDPGDPHRTSALQNIADTASRLVTAWTRC